MNSRLIQSISALAVAGALQGQPAAKPPTAKHPATKPTEHKGLATVYGPPVDTNAGGKLACLNAKRLRFRSSEAAALYEAGLFVAATNVRCWTIVRIKLAGSATSCLATVADSLPKKHWRSWHDFDLWSDLARVLNFDLKRGIVPMVWSVVNTESPNTS